MSRVVGAQRETWKPGAHQGRLVAMRRLRRLSWSGPDGTDSPRQVLIGDVVVLPGAGLPGRIWTSHIIHSTALITAMLRQPVGGWVVGVIERGHSNAWVLSDVTDAELDAVREWLDAHSSDLLLLGAVQEDEVASAQRRADEVTRATREALRRGRGGAQ